MEQSPETSQAETREFLSLAERESLIKNIPFFSTWTVAQISLLSSFMQEVYLEAGSILVSEGDIIDSIYLIASGSIEISKKVITKGKVGTSLIALLNSGDSIGLKDTRLFSSQGTRTATATANTNCVLLKVTITDLERCSQDSSELSLELQKNLDLVLKMQFIKEVQPFSHLTNERIAWMVPFIQEKNYEEKEIIFKENEEANSCYMVYEGEVVLYKKQKDGSEKELSLLTKGAFFGENAFFSSSKRMASAFAKTPCKLFVLDQSLLVEMGEKQSVNVETLRAMLIEHHHPIRKENILFYHKKTSDAQDLFILKDSEEGNYIQLNKEGWLLWQQLEGKKSFDEILRDIERISGKVEASFYLKLINNLFDKGFIYFESMDATQLKSSKTESMHRLKTISIKKPDKKIGFFYKKIGFLFFNKISLMAFFLFSLYGSYIFYTSIPERVKDISNQANLVFLLALAVAFGKIFQLLNPFFKALTIKHFNYDIPNIALSLSWYNPQVFLDTSDLLLSPKIPRISVNVSGVFVEFFWASFLSFVSIHSVNSLFFWLSSIYLYLSFFRRLNPLLDLEGYALLADILDVVNLREKAFLCFGNGSFWKKEHLAFWTLYLVYLVSFLAVFKYFLLLLTSSIIYCSLLVDLSLFLICTAYFIETWLEYRYYKRVEKISESASSG